MEVKGIWLVYNMVSLLVTVSFKTVNTFMGYSFAINNLLDMSLLFVGLSVGLFVGRAPTRSPTKRRNYVRESLRPLMIMGKAQGSFTKIEGDRGGVPTSG